MSLSSSTSLRQYSIKEVSSHGSRSSCWIVLFNKIYDVTDFLSQHPGGAQLLLDCGGKVASKVFSDFHQKSVLSMLPPSCYLGELLEDEGKVGEAHTAVGSGGKSVECPPLEHMLNIYDFEQTAFKILPNNAWDYYSTGSLDEISLRDNHSAFQRLWLKPRVLINVSKIDISSSILGIPTSMPIYITATGLGKLAHPEGELAISRAAFSRGIVQMLPTYSSYSTEEIMKARQGGQPIFYALYVLPDRREAEKMVRMVESLGCRVLCVTVDAPIMGKREKDMRNKFSSTAVSKVKVEGTKGVAHAFAKFVDPAFIWNDLKWLKSITKLPIVIKGIQCGEDAVLAAQHGVQGIILSNHGGRQLDFARSGIEILPEVMAALRQHNIPVHTHNKPIPGGFEVWLDGGVRRGTDVFKALALGATAVGIGRPIVYGLAGYGQAGAEKVLDIFKEELEIAMSLMGTPSLKDIKEQMVIADSLNDHSNGMPDDFLRLQTYIKLKPFAYNQSKL